MSTRVRESSSQGVGARASRPQRSTAQSAKTLPPDRPEVRGKFFWVGSRQVFVRGVTYGPFRPDDKGSEYHDEYVVDRDFAAMAASGINTVRTYTLPPTWVLDCAARHGLWVMVGVAWAEHVTFLDRPEARREILETLRRAVRTCNWHPAVLAYVIGNEIPAPIVRWYGARRIERFLKRLYYAVKDEDPRALVTYVNYPTTEYLHLPFLDFCAWNVYLERPESLDAYIARLHNLAGDRPVVLAELGLDSCRHGEDRQAEALEWQVCVAFEGGCAGVCVFSWTDEWFRGGQDIDGWGFGVTDRLRRPKPARRRLAAVFADTPFPRETCWPSVSVVVCTYNGARTLLETCEGLSRLDYPNHEVIVVCDGSTDDSLHILSGFNFRVVKIENGGLSRARNVGIREARGEIVAYLDDDAYPAPDWLKHLAWAFMHSPYAGVGGPNVPPAGDGVIAESVVHSPGGPNHVLINDQIAEHIPGCNMAFRRSWLLQVGGFDEQFTIAGDDVDLCWKIQEAGGVLGFSPTALVWHHRRSTIRGYLRQQWNYGRAEAMLAAKWPLRFNSAGHVRWSGKIYGRGAPLASLLGQRIYHGTWGTAPFQSLYERPRSVLSALPQMPEWYLFVCVVGIVSLTSIYVPLLRAAVPVLLAAVAIMIWQAVRAAAAAHITGRVKGAVPLASTRILIVLLQLLQPVWRLDGRLSLGLHPWRWPRPGPFGFSGFGAQEQWYERWESGEARLTSIEQALFAMGAHPRRGGNFDRWDLEVPAGTFGGARLLMAIEEHAQGAQLVRVRIRPRLRAAAVLILAFALAGVFVSLAAGAGRAALLLCLPIAVAVLRAVAECSAAAGWIRHAVGQRKEMASEAETTRALVDCRTPGVASLA